MLTNPSPELLAMLGIASKAEYLERARDAIADFHTKMPQLQNTLAKHDYKELSALCYRIRSAASILRLDSVVSLAGAIHIKARNAPDPVIIAELIRQLIVEVQNLEFASRQVQPNDAPREDPT
ncbi:MAG TPA: hypothetical protein PLP29_03815 [Candidatus Ozemobacteraceae bacterium]|nr:hypothetical protein [Candidatus Ozemobacteraceae bacterium]